MQTKIMSIFTRTPLHVGCGSSVGAVDQPVVRERHTGYPVIPGSAIKGVLADLWNENYQRTTEGKVFFGEDDVHANAKAGKIAFGEAKLRVLWQIRKGVLDGSLRPVSAVRRA